jgi:hypothetical protein
MPVLAAIADSGTRSSPRPAGDVTGAGLENPISRYHRSADP